MDRFHRQSQAGEVIADLPAALLVLFILLMLPMINLATATYRAYLVRTAVLEAVHRAGRAQSFMHDLPADPTDPAQPSAQSIFATYINQAITDQLLAQGQLSLPTPALCCVAEPIVGGAPAVYTSPLPAYQINRFKNTYFFELRGATAVVQPLLPFSSPLFPKIQGVTAPMTIEISARQMVEAPAGLAF